MSTQEQLQQAEALTELRAMVVAYDGSAPFPEFVERYVQVHPSRWDFRGVSPYIFPLGDPRNCKDEGEI